MTFESAVATFGARQVGAEWMATCPGHDDGTASLALTQGADGRTLLHCHGGCTVTAVLAARGLHLRDLFATTTTTTTAPTKPPIVAYDYTDETGALLFQSVRLPSTAAGKKDFRQRRPDGSGGWVWKLDGVRRVLYRLDQLKGQQAVFLVEGEKDADRLWSLGLPATTNPGGAGNWKDEYTGQLVAAGAQSVVMLPDNDPPGRSHMAAAAASGHAGGLTVQIVALPGLPVKGDVSDWLDAGHTKPELMELVKTAPLYAPSTASSAAPAPQRPTAPTTLADVHTAFRRWLGAEYDMDAINVTLAAAAVERMDGDPLWLLLISGSGNAKTETVQALSGAGAIVTSTITSDGALLSGSPKRDKATDATGGLLRRLGSTGTLVIKDVTSILSMNRDARGSVLAAFREVHDGRWERNIGTDGGRTLLWTGRVTVVGAVTTAWDHAHDVIASMGDRFVLLRMDSSRGRIAAGRRAVANTGDEVTMRAELAAVVGGALAHLDPAVAGHISVTDAERDRILAAADVVTLSRTGVSYDYRGNVIEAHAPEMPTRFAKQLAQVMRGAIALGMDRATALRLALRCARDSMPPLRLDILDDVAANPGTLTKDVRRRLAKPRATVDRQLQALQMLGVLVCDEEESIHRGQPATLWRYRLANGIDPDVLDTNSVPEMSAPVMSGDASSSLLNLKTMCGDKSGTEFQAPAHESEAFDL